MPQISQMIGSGEYRDPESHAVIGAAMAVHRELGCGFLEAVYQEALELELQGRRIPFTRQAHFELQYRGHALRTRYRADLVCYNSLIVELKAIRRLTENDTSQVINYLKASGLRKALLINFGSTSLQFRRLVLQYHQSASSAKSADSAP